MGVAATDTGPSDVVLDAPPGVAEEALADLTAFVTELEPERITTARAVELVGVFAQLKRVVAAGEMLLARRAAQSDCWKRDGHRSAASWMAKTAGTGLGEAMTLLQTAERLEKLPGTTAALKQGTLSSSQVKEIAAAAVERPSAEGELLDVAKAGTFCT
ncbi:MAG: DUF222 domain-containing protein [Acidimicrobiales bacterium]|jgi:hypothetical protein